MKKYEEAWFDNLSKSYKDKIPPINKKEDFVKLEQDLRKQREEIRKIQINMIREEKMQEIKKKTKMINKKVMRY